METILRKSTLAGAVVLATIVACLAVAAESGSPNTLADYGDSSTGGPDTFGEKHNSKFQR